MFPPLTFPLRLCGLTLMVRDREIVGGQETTGLLQLNPNCLAALRQGRLRLDLSFSETALATASFDLGAPQGIPLRISTNPVARQTPVVMKAELILEARQFGDVPIDTAETTLTLQPPLMLDRLIVAPMRVSGPQRVVTVVVTFNRPARAGEFVTIAVPGYVEATPTGLRAGQTSSGLMFAVNPVLTERSVPVMATVNGMTLTETLRIAPA